MRCCFRCSHCCCCRRCSDGFSLFLSLKLNFPPCFISHFLGQGIIPWTSSVFVLFFFLSFFCCCWFYFQRNEYFIVIHISLSFDIYSAFVNLHCALIVSCVAFCLSDVYTHTVKMNGISLKERLFFQTKKNQHRATKRFYWHLCP